MLKHKANIKKSQKIFCKAKRKQHLNFWEEDNNLWESLWLTEHQGFPKIKQAFLEGGEARAWHTAWFSHNLKIWTLHHKHTQEEYFWKLNPSSNTCKHGEWITVPLCRCVKLKILVTDHSCRSAGNEQIKQLLHFQLNTTCYMKIFWWKSRLWQLIVAQSSNQPTPLQSQKLPQRLENKQ